MSATSIYLDNNATTPVLPEVVSAMEPFWYERFGNPSSIHGLGVDADRALENARQSTASRLGAQADEIIFTSGASESLNTALLGFASRNKRRGKHIVTTPVEHDCALVAIQALEESGCEVTYLKTDQYGAVTPDTVQSAIRSDTVLVSIMHVNNELGTINPIEEIASSVKKAGLSDQSPFMVVDGVQAFGKLSVDLTNIDAYAISAHKIHGPKGVGALYVDRNIQRRLDPLIRGGGQEHGLRAGTHNVPGIVGFAKASELAHTGREEHYVYTQELRGTLLRVLAEIPDAIINSPEDGIPGTVSVAIPGIPAETMLHALEERGIYVSSGSACSSRTSVSSHVLAHITDRGDIKRSTLRFGLSRLNTHDEIKRAGEALYEVITDLRSVLP